MSIKVQYDPILVRYLTAELDARLRGRACAAAPEFAPDRSVVLAMEGGDQLRVDLHPDRGWFRFRKAASPGDGILDAICTGADCPVDERIIRIHLEVTGRFADQKRTLIFELPTNQWNAILVDGSGDIVNLLRGRKSEARRLGPGLPYEPPPADPRFGSEAIERDEAFARWMELLGNADQQRPKGELINHFAWTGTANADWILDADGWESRFERWWWLRSMPQPQPGILRLRRGPLPYPLALRGVQFDPTDDLLAAMDRVADERADAKAGDVIEPGGEAAAFAKDQMDAALRKARSLSNELEGSESIDELRAQGDLLLARLHLVTRGVDRVELEGWEGEMVELRLDPELSPSENATAFYEEAKRKERAQQRLPGLIEAAEGEAARWREALTRIDSGETPQWVAKKLEERRGQAGGSIREAETSRSYRRFRTSGGLEVRVGRSSKTNDRLTFHDSAPNDIWLHARSVPGSHVILRWNDAEMSPPARDLAEAAQLAAVHSRARTSATVPVDWTRRKYVRKPRGAGPGLVIPQRVKTVFVEPDAGVVERLAEE